MKTNYNYQIFFVIVGIFLGVFLPVSGKATPPTQIFLDFNDTQLIYNHNGATIINAGLNMVYDGTDWEVKQFGSYLYHMRNKDWKDYYWKLDTNLKEVYKITGGIFGSQGGSESLVKGISVRLEKIGREEM